MPRSKFRFEYNNGGRDKDVGPGAWDCLTRAVALTSNTSYKTVQEEIDSFCSRIKKLHTELIKEASQEDLSTLFGVEVSKEKLDFVNSLFSGDYSSESGVSGFIANGYLEYKKYVPGIVKPNMKYTDLPEGNYILGYEITEIEIDGEIRKIPSAGHFVAFIDGVFHDTNEIMAKRYSKKPILFYWKKEN